MNKYRYKTEPLLYFITVTCVVLFVFWEKYPFNFDAVDWIFASVLIIAYSSFVYAWWCSSEAEPKQCSNCGHEI